VSGGFVAVVWSDVFQGTLMFVGLVALPIVGITMIGGVDEMMAGLAAIDPDLTRLSGPGGWSAKRVLEIIGLSLIGLGFLGSPQIFVRLLSLRSDKEIAPGAAVALIWTIFADSGAVLTGMVGRALLAPAGMGTEMLGNGGQNVLPLLVEYALPTMLVGLFIAIVLSAIMSTVDSLLIVASSAVVRDWYQQVKHPEISDADLIGLSRKVTVGLALISLAMAFTVATLVPGRTVFWFVIFGWSGIAATFCPTMILSLFWSKFTARGAMVAMIVGFIGVPIFKFGAPALPEIGWVFTALSELPPAFLLSGIAGVLVSLMDPAGQAALNDISDELDEAAS
jgi:Na+/proline symporter